MVPVFVLVSWKWHLAVGLQQQEILQANYASFLDNKHSWMLLLVPAWDQTDKSLKLLKSFYKDPPPLFIKQIIELEIHLSKRCQLSAARELT